MDAKNVVSLKAMAESKLEGVQKATYFKVNPNLVEFEEGFNLREEGPELDAYLESLYQAMKAGAAVPPIDASVVDGRIIARDGHCRTRVARRLVAEGIPYVLEARQYRGNDADCVLHMLGTAQGKSLTPLEQGRGFLRLIRYGMTVPQIVERTGLHRNTIDNWLILAEAPSEIQQMLSRGEVAAIVAVEMVRKHGAKAADVLKGKVEKVKATGQTKVTKKHVSGPRMSTKVQHQFISAATEFKAACAFHCKLPELAAMSDEQLVDVSLPAKTVRALLEAHDKCVIQDDGEL